MIATRPLSIGEVFDRGITLFVRNAPLVAALAALYVVPYALVERCDHRTLFGTLVTLAVSPPAALGALLRPVDTVGRVALVLHGIALLFAVPLFQASIAAALGFADRGAAPSLIGALRIGTAHWRASLAVWIASIVVTVVAGTLFVGGVTLPSLIGAWFLTVVGLSGAGSGIAIQMVLAVSVLLAACGLLVMYVVNNIATCVVLFEGFTGRASFRIAWRRTIRAPRRVVAVAGLEIIMMVTAYLVEILVYNAIVRPTHLSVLLSVMSVLFTVVLSGLTWGVKIVLYEDQRLRSEGDDRVASLLRAGTPVVARIA